MSNPCEVISIGSRKVFSLEDQSAQAQRFRLNDSLQASRITSPYFYKVFQVRKYFSSKLIIHEPLGQPLLQHSQRKHGLSIGLALSVLSNVAQAYDALRQHLQVDPESSIASKKVFISIHNVFVTEKHVRLEEFLLERDYRDQYQRSYNGPFTQRYDVFLCALIYLRIRFSRFKPSHLPQLYHSTQLQDADKKIVTLLKNGEGWREFVDMIVGNTSHNQFSVRPAPVVQAPQQLSVLRQNSPRSPRSKALVKTSKLIKSTIQSKVSTKRREMASASRLSNNRSGVLMKRQNSPSASTLAIDVNQLMKKVTQLKKKNYGQSSWPDKHSSMMEPPINYELNLKGKHQQPAKYLPQQKQDENQIILPQKLVVEKDRRIIKQMSLSLVASIYNEKIQPDKKPVFKQPLFKQPVSKQPVPIPVSRLKMVRTVQIGLGIRKEQKRTRKDSSLQQKSSRPKQEKPLNLEQTSIAELKLGLSEPANKPGNNTNRKIRKQKMQPVKEQAKERQEASKDQCSSSRSNAICNFSGRSRDDIEEIELPMMKDRGQPQDEIEQSKNRNGSDIQQRNRIQVSKGDAVAVTASQKKSEKSSEASGPVYQEANQRMVMKAAPVEFKCFQAAEESKAKTKREEGEDSGRKATKKEQAQNLEKKAVGQHAKEVVQQILQNIEEYRFVPKFLKDLERRIKELRVQFPWKTMAYFILKFYLKINEEFKVFVQRKGKFKLKDKKTVLAEHEEFKRLLAMVDGEIASLRLDLKKAVKEAQLENKESKLCGGDDISYEEPVQEGLEECFQEFIESFMKRWKKHLKQTGSSQLKELTGELLVTLIKLYQVDEYMMNVSSFDPRVESIDNFLAEKEIMLRSVIELNFSQ